MKKLVQLLSILFICTFMSSCYSFSSSTLPKNIKTITIYPAANNTMQATMGDNLTESIKKIFKLQVPDVKQINNSTHAEFFITIKEYSNQPLGYSADATIKSYQVTIVVDVLFKDLVNDEILYEGIDVIGHGDYNPLTEDEVQDGQKRAIEYIEQLIITNSLSAW